MLEKREGEVGRGESPDLGPACSCPLVAGCKRAETETDLPGFGEPTHRCTATDAIAFVSSVWVGGGYERAMRLVPG